MGIDISRTENICKRARGKFVGYLLVNRVYNWQNLSNEVGIGVVRVEDQSFDIGAWFAVFMLDGPAFAGTGNAIQEDICSTRNTRFFADFDNSVNVNIIQIKSADFDAG